MSLHVITTKSFNRAFKKLIKSGSFRFDKFEMVIHFLSNKSKLPSKYKDHDLAGNWIGFREYHIEFDLLLIYQIEDNELRLIEIGSHSELFG